MKLEYNEKIISFSPYICIFSEKESKLLNLGKLLSFKSEKRSHDNELWRIRDISVAEKLPCPSQPFK